MPKSDVVRAGRWKWLSENVDRACIVRTVIVVLFLAAAVVGGIYTEIEVRTTKQRVQDDRYGILSNRSLASLTDSLRRRMQGLAVLSKVAGHSRENASAWPNSFVPGFYDTVKDLHQMIYLDNICFMPVVQPDELPAFETFMYKYFDSEPAIPPDAGVHPFGKGVYALNPHNLSEMYHDTTGRTLRYDSPHTFLTPVLQMLHSDETANLQFTFNAHSSPYIGPLMDFIVDTCIPMLNGVNETRQCGAITDALLYNRTSTDYRSVILQPVLFGHNQTDLIGFTRGGMSWQRILAQSFYAYVGFDVVIENGDNRFTYSINRIEYSADFVGRGDLHDPQYSKYRVELVVSAELLDLVFAPPYTIYVYPNDVFFQDSLSNTSIIIGVAVGVVIGLATLIFAMYDIFMRRETRRKAHMLTAKRKFVRFISHEIRTPLNSVHMGLELLLEELKHLTDQLNAAPGISVSLLARVREALAEWLELLADLVGNNESAVDVLNDLLNYDKIEMGTLRLDFAAVLIWALVEKVAASFKMQAKQKDIVLNSHDRLLEKFRLDEVPTLVVIGDSGRIAQVLRNLLSNALKFTSAGGAITVTAEWRTDGLPGARSLNLPEEKLNLLQLPRTGSVHISVQDTGVGLTTEQLAQIGAEGIQFDANKLQAGQGSGLGLYISKGLMTQHGGKLHVTSEGSGKGSTFSIELPLYRNNRENGTAMPPKISHDGEVKDEAHQDTVSARRASCVRRVLVVDDAASNRKMLIRLLTARGFHCEQAEDGQQAIDVYRALQDKGELVDIIVMDFEMPVMNGPTATRKLRELGCTCLIVGVTGNLLPENVDYFKAQGADAVLGKPLNIKTFEEVLKQGGEVMQHKGEKKSNGTSNGIEMA